MNEATTAVAMEEAGACMLLIEAAPNEVSQRVVEKTSVQVPEVQLVVPGNLEASYLWHKLMGETEIGKGMPRTMFGSKRLPEKELDLFRQWIENGAKP